MLFSEGIFPHERVELHVEFSVFQFFCMLKKNTTRWTCGTLVKFLAVADLLYAYPEIVDRKLSVVGFLRLYCNPYVESEI